MPAGALRGQGNASSDGRPLLSLVGAHKRYGGVHALRGADLVVSGAGVVHALMGQNGSGKSTLLGILCGEVSADSGTFTLDGEEVRLRSPGDALAHGIAMVSQETHIAPELSVAENVLLGRRLVRTALGVDWKATNRRAAEVLARLELDYNPEWKLRDLRTDQQQMVEIARALSFDPKILILDEPTSSLTVDEVQSLFRALDVLREKGVSVLLVSHRIPEVLEMSDEITVLRDGKTVARGSTGEFNAESLVTAMIGDKTQLQVPERRITAREGAAPILSVHGLAAAPGLFEATLEVFPGEIVGLSGLVGSGCSELLEVIFGVRAKSAGSIEISGEAVSASEPRELVARGVGYLPPDRKTQALVGCMSIRDNLTMVGTLDRPRLSSPRGPSEATAFERAAKAVGLKVPSPAAAVSTLSGGNQQKVAIGRWLVRDPRLLLLAEPTRGVDVAAKADIHARIREVSDGGAGVLVSSSESQELLDLCDRIVVLFAGRVVASRARHELDEAKLTALEGGHS